MFRDNIQGANLVHLFPFLPARKSKPRIDLWNVHGIWKVPGKNVRTMNEWTSTFGTDAKLNLNKSNENLHKIKERLFHFFFERSGKMRRISRQWTYVIFLSLSRSLRLFERIQHFYSSRGRTRLAAATRIFVSWTDYGGVECAGGEKEREREGGREGGRRERKRVWQREETKIAGYTGRETAAAAASINLSHHGARGRLSRSRAPSTLTFSLSAYALFFSPHLLRQMSHAPIKNNGGQSGSLPPAC